MRDSEYNYLSNSVYEVDVKKVSKSWKEGDTLEEGGYNNNFKILQVEDNQENGMQAMAVAPVNERGEVDTRRIVIAYAGTNFADSNDRNTDIQNVIMGLPVVTIKNYFYNIPEVKLNQIETAVYFAKNIRNQ